MVFAIIWHKRALAAGAVLRLTALCTDEASAARLTQALLARAAQVIYEIQV